MAPLGGFLSSRDMGLVKNHGAMLAEDVAVLLGFPDVRPLMCKRLHCLNSLRNAENYVVIDGKAGQPRQRKPQTMETNNGSSGGSHTSSDETLDKQALPISRN